MDDAISIIVPAYAATHTIVRAVKSVVAQTHTRWELIIIADDNVDYAAVLAQSGIVDDRLHFFATGHEGFGSPLARNIGLEAAQYRYIAILDADDLMHHDKLARAVQILPEYGIVSSALQVTDAQLQPLRQVGAGPDLVLRAGDYKFTNISMDSMLLYDRHRADPRFDLSFPCLTDIDFLLKLFAHNARCFHFGTPLHTYVKEPESVSNKPGASAQLIDTKKRLLGLLASGHYALADPDGLAGMMRFWELSLDAEEAYGPLLAANPALLFEDHLEPRLRTVLTSDA